MSQDTPPTHDHSSNGTGGTTLSPLAARINGAKNFISQLGEDTPAVIRTTNNNRALALQTRTEKKFDSDGDLLDGYAAPLDWLSPRGERYLRISGTVGGDGQAGMTVYVKPDAVGDPPLDTQPAPIMSMQVGTTDRRLVEFGDPEKGDTVVRAQPGGSNNSATFELLDGDRNQQVFLGYLPDAADGEVIRFFDFVNGGRIFEYMLEDQEFDWFQTPLTGLREVGPQPSASDLSSGEWAFTKDRDGNGNAAWLFKDSTGTAHFLNTDGTL